MGRVEMAIIRAITNSPNERLSVPDIADQVNAERDLVYHILQDWVRSGYAAKLDHSEYCLTLSGESDYEHNI